MATLHYDKKMVFGTILFAACWPFSGCGGAVRFAMTAAVNSSGTSADSVLKVLPEATALDLGSVVTFTLEGEAPGFSACQWSASDPSILAMNSAGIFAATKVGSTEVVALCGNQKASSSVTVGGPAVPSPKTIQITSGGTYTGDWTSNDPTVPAVTIKTDQPVILRNATVSGRGTLVQVTGVAQGAHVMLDNVTGTALDPQSSGHSRGAFLTAESAASLSVTHCTMHGVSMGVYVVNSNLSALTISNNLATEMEDRATDGSGNLLTTRPFYGHYIQLNKVSAPNGGDIGWNQVINTLGNASVEDMIDMYDSRGGSATATIHIHDNYLQGAFSSGSKGYSGGGIMSEGSAMDASLESAFLLIENNVVVQTANYGIAISAGHDVTMLNNRVVSCGIDGSGKWVAGLFGNAGYLWNIGNEPHFFSNTIVGTTGGLVRPDSSGKPMTADMWAPSSSQTLSNGVIGWKFDDPCWSNGALVSNKAELTERAKWDATVASSGELLGDQHMP